MIAAMSRVAVLGPRRLQGAVVKEVQDLGALHVDHIRATEEGFESRALSGDDQAARDAIDGVRTRAEAILTLLPVIETPPISTAPFANQTPDALRGRLEALEAEVKDLTRRLLDAEEEQEILRAYGRALDVLSPLLLLLESSRSLEAVGFVLEATPGSLEAVRGDLNRATQGRLELVSRPVDDHRVGAVAAFARQDAEAVRAVLARAGVSELRLPASVRGQPLGEAVPYLVGRARDLPHIIEDLRRQLMELSRRHRAEVSAIATVARDAVHRFEIMSQIPQSRYAFALYGWVPTKHVPMIREGLRKRFGPEVVVYDEPAPVQHADHVPVLLENPGWLRPFELFLAVFDPPRYGTFDLTLLFAIGLPLWVGLIIGDIGYGLPLLALTLWLRAKAQAGRPWRAIVAGLDFGFTLSPSAMRSVAVVLGWMTAWTFLFGIVFGEVFGDLPQRLFPATAHQWSLWHSFDRLENRMAYLYLSIGFGLAQVYLGLGLQVVKSIRHGARGELLEAVALACGGGAIFLSVATKQGVLPKEFFSPVILGAAGLFLIALVLSFSIWSLMWVMESISTFGNFLSYARIAAFGLASLGLANVANTLAAELGGGFPAIVLGIFVGLVAHVTFYVLTIMGHVLQPARLYWVEFFSKFKYYEDTGPAYRPFQHSGGGET